MSCIIVRPGHKTLEEWAKTCLAVEHYEGEDHFGGWSPGRSVEVQVTTADGTEERVEAHYYKLFDFNAADVDLHPVQTRPLPEPLAWLPVWKRLHPHLHPPGPQQHASPPCRGAR